MLVQKNFLIPPPPKKKHSSRTFSAAFSFRAAVLDVFTFTVAKFKTLILATGCRNLDSSFSHSFSNWTRSSFPLTSVSRRYLLVDSFAALQISRRMSYEWVACVVHGPASSGKTDKLTKFGHTHISLGDSHGPSPEVIIIPLFLAHSDGTPLKTDKASLFLPNFLKTGGIYRGYQSSTNHSHRN